MHGTGPKILETAVQTTYGTRVQATHGGRSRETCVTYSIKGARHCVARLDTQHAINPTTIANLSQPETSKSEESSHTNIANTSASQETSTLPPPPPPR